MRWTTLFAAAALTVAPWAAQATPPRIGFQGAPLPQGLQVVWVSANCPAVLALRVGDYVTSVGGFPVRTVEESAAIIESRYPIGSWAPLGLIRDGQEIQTRALVTDGVCAGDAGMTWMRTAVVEMKGEPAISVEADAAMWRSLGPITPPLEDALREIEAVTMEVIADGVLSTEEADRLALLTLDALKSQNPEIARLPPENLAAARASLAAQLAKTNLPSGSTADTMGAPRRPTAITPRPVVAASPASAVAGHGTGSTRSVNFSCSSGRRGTVSAPSGTCQSQLDAHAHALACGQRSEAHDTCRALQQCLGKDVDAYCPY